MSMILVVSKYLNSAQNSHITGFIWQMCWAQSHIGNLGFETHCSVAHSILESNTHYLAGKLRVYISEPRSYTTFEQNIVPNYSILINVILILSMIILIYYTGSATRRGSWPPPRESATVFCLRSASTASVQRYLGRSTLRVDLTDASNNL